ncbi:MAG: uroporphyrinogen decarboxylase family protein [Candidatus Geothermarchaeales archaeon]
MTPVEDLSEANSRRILDAASLREPDQVPVYLPMAGGWLAEFYGVKERMIYFLPDIMLEAMLAARRRLHGLIDIKPELGMVIEASALGCKIKWPEDAPPWVTPCVRDASDVDTLKIPDPHRDALMAYALEIYGYMEKRIQERGLNIPVGMPNSVGGPFTLAGTIAGLNNLLVWVGRQPDVAHELIGKCMEAVIVWCETQREVAGRSLPVFLLDDYSGFISPHQFREFSLPYIREIFERLDHPLNVYHNDAPTSHLLELFPETGMKIFHMGPGDTVDLEEAKRKIGSKICLMGNIDPVKTLSLGTPEEVEKECLGCIKTAAEGGGFILAPGGALCRGIPLENLETLMGAVGKYGRYPLEL